MSYHQVRERPFGPCGAGRQLVSDSPQQPRWNQPCPNQGTDVLMVPPAYGSDGFVMELCRAHIDLLQPERIA